jgi:hypothetical protein
MGSSGAWIAWLPFRLDELVPASSAEQYTRKNRQVQAIWGCIRAMIAISIKRWGDLFITTSSLISLLKKNRD